ncbi:MAG: DUF86 domain-containing protein [Salinivirgaceae bacterium]|nr:DUF86 domain-containing protein [Salinivirgaceae bacterium]
METSERDQLITSKIMRYCDEIAQTHKSFETNKDLFFDKENGFIYRNSISMPILQIGELVKTLSDDFKTEHVGVPWRDIGRMRDLFAHRYGTIDYEMTWNTSIEDVPELRKYLANTMQ